MQETLLVDSQACRRRGRRTRATNIPGRNVSMAPRNIQMAAMDNPVFDYVVFYFLINITCMISSDQRRCPGTLILSQTDAGIAGLALP